MGISVSIPDDLAARVEAVARRQGTSTERLAAEALEALVAREERRDYAPGEITAALDASLDGMTDGEIAEETAFARAASAGALRRSEW